MRHLGSHVLSVLLLAAGCSGPERKVAETEAVTATRGCGPSLVHDRDWYTSGKVQRLFPGLDRVHLPISSDAALPQTRRDSVQRYFDQGLLLAYGFNHAEAARSFWQATRLDSTCAMAWWALPMCWAPTTTRAWKRTATGARTPPSVTRKRT